jgi:hypothetical protein
MLGFMTAEREYSSGMDRGKRTLLLLLFFTIGISFVHSEGFQRELSLKNPRMNGSDVAAADLNGDGRARS